MSESLDVFFNDDLMATDVVIDGRTVRGILDQPDEVIGGGLVISTEYLLTMKTTDVDGVVEGGVLVIDGADFFVRTIKAIDDGKLTRLALSKA